MLSKYARHPLLAGNPDPLPVSYLPHIFKHRPSTHGVASLTESILGKQMTPSSPVVRGASF